MSIEPERGGEAVTIDAEIEPGQQVAIVDLQEHSCQDAIFFAQK